MVILKFMVAVSDCAVWNVQPDDDISKSQSGLEEGVCSVYATCLTTVSDASGG